MKLNQKIVDAWAAYAKDSETDDLDALRAEGWRLPADFCKSKDEIHIIRQRMSRDRKLDRKAVRVLNGGMLRTVIVYRPKLKIALPVKKV